MSDAGTTNVASSPTVMLVTAADSVPGKPSRGPELCTHCKAPSPSSNSGIGAERATSRVTSDGGRGVCQPLPLARVIFNMDGRDGSGAACKRSYDRESVITELRSLPVDKAANGAHL